MTAKHKEIYLTIPRCLAAGERALLLTKTEGLPFQKMLITEQERTWGDLSVAHAGKAFARFFRDFSPSIRDGLLIEPVIPVPHLYVYGAGHISQHISRMAKTVDFHVTVIDDRTGFANRERFPEADEVIVEEFRDLFGSRHPQRGDYAVIVTRGHKHDALVLEEVLKRPPRYVGMIGSRRKVRILYEDLLAKGIEETRLQAVRAPIGIDIGAETPQEIAVSIIAELIKVRSGYR